MSTTPETGRALELVAVTKTYKAGSTTTLAVQAISLTVQPGELVAVMGPSGSGKTTLLNIAGGLESPDSGQVLVDGQDLTTMTRANRTKVRRRNIGYVFQNLNLVSTLTARENITLPLELDGVNSAHARAAADEVLADMELSDIALKFPSELSGGQQQRVAIARAVVGDRRILLADEPTGALDSATGESVMALLRTRVDRGSAGLLVTHEPRYAAWADRTIFIRDGVIVDDTGSREDPIDLLRAN